MIARRRVRWRAALVVVAAALALPISGCGPAAEPTDDPRPRVVAAFYPLAWVSEQVSGEHAVVANLTTPGGEPHDLELGFRENVEVAEADLVVVEGGFQAAVDQSVAAVAEGRVIDVADVVTLRSFGAEDQHQHESGTDPHFWLDPLLLADVADAVAGAMAEIDAAHAPAYTLNARGLRAELEALDADYTTGLTDCTRDTVVVSHEAFGYLERYGVHFEAINGLSPDAEPTPADLARLQQLARDLGITTVFSETLASPKLAETLAQDLGIRTGVLDPLEGLSDQTAGADYLTLMRANLAALKEANGC